jgi:predicted MPP superfamily phosphohydrolase
MRRLQGIGFFIILAVLILIEYYAFTAFRFAIRSVRNPYKTYLVIVYILFTVLWVICLFSFPSLRTADVNKNLRNIIVIFSMGMLLSKLFIASILLIDDIRRFVFYVIGLFYTKQTIPLQVQDGMTRSSFLTKLSLLIGGTVFGTILYGMNNRYNYSMKNIQISFQNLPSAFKGLKIVQISDIHSGSFSNPDAVKKGVDMIMQYAPDLILFTGDLVNNQSDEMLPYISVFNQLKAPLGIFSIFGNHDYGDYVEWESAEAKQQNLQQLKHIHEQLGWRLLLDEHVILSKQNQQIALLGVQNISAKGFQSYGNLAKAYSGTTSIPFKILLSHDPSHWDSETVTKFKDIDLTLSGHTHGMQFGIDIPWLKWSPVQYAYKRWAGLYQKENQYLYVNRGFGFIGYPGRVGIMPEITAIELS